MSKSDASPVERVIVLQALEVDGGLSLTVLLAELSPPTRRT